MTAPSITVTPILVADLHVEGERMPVYVHLIDHPEARVLVDAGCWCEGSPPELVWLAHEHKPWRPGPG